MSGGSGTGGGGTPTTTVIGRTVLVGEDALPMAGAHLWVDLANDAAVSFQLFRTSAAAQGQGGGVVEGPSGAALVPEGRHRLLARRPDGPAIDGGQAQALARDGARPKAFLKVAADGRAEALADVRPDAWRLLSDAKAAGLLDKLDGWAEKG